MSFYSPRFADRLRGMSKDELLREVKQRFNEDNGEAFFESDRPTRGDSFNRPFTHFPRGFPFDDDADVFDHPRGNGIRAHLDDLAARHPEFAEHLRGPPWPFSDSLLRDRRRRRRGSGGSNEDQQQQGPQHQVDEDARSQASGSSAASGASAVSSRSGEHDLTSSSAIPHYGLRNTVDIGQQQRSRGMEISPEKGERGQRSMSAPPESWQQQQSQPQGQDQQFPQSGQGQRFVSRVDITPQHNQQQQRAQSPSKPASNVRHIPIFVEGRDVPVMPKVAADDAPSFQRQSSPPSHLFDRSSPPAHHFHRPSHFNERFSRQQWPPSHFQDAFYKPAGFEQPMRRNQFEQQHQQPQHYYQESQQQPQEQPQHHHQQYQQPHYHHQQQPQHHHEQHQQQQFQQPQYNQEQQEQQQQETPKPKPAMPKDPLEKVAQVQKEVDDLAEQVRRYIGGTRQDKEYMYLDEMLTRELIKLDDIETEGRENVRQARKNAIKSIQDTISLLETKTPLANQQQPIVHKEVQQCAERDHREEEISQVPESMETDVKQEKLSNKPIPLPPAPSSPTKTKAEVSESESAAMAVESANQSAVPVNQQDTKQKTENVAAEDTKQFVAPMLTDEVTKCADEMTEKSKPSDGQDGAQQKDGDVSQTTMENKYATPKQQAKEATEGKTEVNDGQRSSTESPRLQKKVKKTKKKEQQQQPVSEQAIPLPPPPPPPPTETAK